LDMNWRLGDGEIAELDRLSGRIPTATMGGAPLRTGQESALKVLGTWRDALLLRAGEGYRNASRNR